MRRKYKFEEDLNTSTDSPDETTPTWTGAIRWHAALLHRMAVVRCRELVACGQTVKYHQNQREREPLAPVSHIPRRLTAHHRPSDHSLRKWQWVDLPYRGAYWHNYVPPKA